MKKFFLFAITLTLMTGISKAAKTEAPAATNASTTNNKATAPAVSSAVSMAELLKENQNLKLALQKTNTENENLAHQVNFAQNMYFATTSLYEVELTKQEEKAKDQATYAWLMHNVIVTLNNLPKNA